MATTIPGPAGRLEVAVGEPAEACDCWIVVCHPHPQYGGNRHNTVVAAIAEAASDLDYGIVTFNFRGVGESAGAFDGGQGEVEDLCAVLAHLEQAHGCPPGRVVVAGYSFGAAVAAQILTREVQPRAALWVSPPIGMLPLPETAIHWNGPKTMLAAEHDQFCAPGEAEALCAAANPPIAYATIPGADHFYGGHEAAVSAAVREWLRTLKEPTP